jgi:NagD protein
MRTPKKIRAPFAVICDLDGVLHCGSHAVRGASGFVERLKRSGRPFLFLTNSPDHSPRELRRKLKKLGIDIPAARFYTSAQAIAAFIGSRSRRPHVYMVGSPALQDELKLAGAVLDEDKPEYVVVASGGRYGTDEIDKAIELILKGARFITASAEATSPGAKGPTSGCGALVAPVERATGRAAYAVGKPNHLMIRDIERLFGFDPKECLMIGDSLDTDIDLGIQAGMKTVLVLSGVTSAAEVKRCACKPDYVFANIGEIDLNVLP